MQHCGINRQDFPTKSMKINYFMHALLGRIYNFPVPPSDTPVCVAGEAEPVLAAALSTQALQRGSAVASPRDKRGSPRRDPGVPVWHTSRQRSPMTGSEQRIVADKNH